MSDFLWNPLVWLAVMVVGTGCASCCQTCMQSHKDAEVAKAAMEHGYTQEIVDGKQCWVRKGTD